MNKELIYILPKDKDKSIKIIYEENFCPILYNLGKVYRCKHAKSKSEDLSFTIFCEKGLKHCDTITFDPNINFIDVE